MTAALLLVGSGNAMAQPSADREAFHVPDAEAVRTMHGVSGCVVRERAGEARRVLAMNFRSDRYRAVLQRLMNASRVCMPRYIGASDLLFAGGMAEHLFLRDHRDEDPTRLLAARPTDFQPRSATEQMGLCVVRQAPVGARAVLAAAPTSREEAVAMNALRPVMADCLASAREARLNRPGLRSLIALAFYHLARARTAAN